MATKNIPEVYTQGMERLCYLSHASEVGYRQTFNGLWTASFSLAADDGDNIYCQPFNLIKIFDGKQQSGLYRIIKSSRKRNQKGLIKYDCEHVIAILLHDALFMYHEIGNFGVYTSEVIQYVLSFQDTKNWRLGKCDFRHQFLYKWENENLCNALFSVPQPFVEPYHWTFDTEDYPWTVNLLAAETDIGCEVRYKKNMQEITKTMDASNTVTEIIPLGSGEGINQLTIKSVNNGSISLKSDTLSTYGNKKLIWTDLRFEDPASLKETALSMLNELKTPYYSYSVSVADIFENTGDEYDKFREGKIVRVVDTVDNISIRTRVVEVNKPDVTKPGITVTLANKSKNVSSDIADLQSRMRISETYAQGTNSLMIIPFNDNADVDAPATFEFYVPEDMTHLNKALLRINIQNFRGYSKAVGGGGAITTTTQNGGGSVETSSSGGSVSTTTSGGGGKSTSTKSGGASQQTSKSTATSSTTTSISNQDEEWLFDIGMTSPSVMGIVDNHSHPLYHHDHPHDHEYTIPGHNHLVEIPDHIHDIDIPEHTHRLTIEPHKHSFSIPAHAHEIKLPAHTHEIEFGIYTGTKAASLTISVDGNKMPAISDYGNIDIVEFLSKSDGGKIKRNAWHNVMIYPDKLTRLSAYLFLNIGTNSRGGKDY